MLIGNGLRTLRFAQFHRANLNGIEQTSKGLIILFSE